MSIILPNGATISVTTIKQIEEIGRQISQREPIITYSIHLDGTVTRNVLWHPDDPVIDFDRIRAGYPRPPPSFFERVVVAIGRVLRINRRTTR